MPKLLSALLALSALVLPARAEGLVQITLHGEITQPGGAPIELELELWNGKEVVPLAVNLHLGEYTRANDLATLLASRLRRLNAKVEHPEAAPGAERTAHLFIEGVTGVHLRLGHGLWGAITLCDAAATSLRVLPPQTARAGARLHVATTTFQGHSRTLGRDEISMELTSQTGSAEISESLASTAIDRGWMADRPRPDSVAWSRTKDGSAITGCSVTLRSSADWRVELKLAVPQAANGFGG